MTTLACAPSMSIKRRSELVLLMEEKSGSDIGLKE